VEAEGGQVNSASEDLFRPCRGASVVDGFPGAYATRLISGKPSGLRVP
jgi:hypothetical protein